MTKLCIWAQGYEAGLAGKLCEVPPGNSDVDMERWLHGWRAGIWVRYKERKPARPGSRIRPVVVAVAACAVGAVALALLL
jgi:ribosome modulation factor